MTSWVRQPHGPPASSASSVRPSSHPLTRPPRRGAGGRFVPTPLPPDSTPHMSNAWCSSRGRNTYYGGRGWLSKSCCRHPVSSHRWVPRVVARTRTDAGERTWQNRALVDQVSAELGKPVGVRQAAAHRRAQKATSVPDGVPYRVADRVVDFEASDCRRLGQLVARVVDFKVVRGGLALLSLQTSAADFRHVLVDASLVSQGHPLLVTLDELFPVDADGG